MNILFLILGVSVLFFAAYKLYGAFLSKKVFELDDSRTTPAVTCNDGVDYVPISSKFLMGQHFFRDCSGGSNHGRLLLE
jgi:carbon starvation protein